MSGGVAAVLDWRAAAAEPVVTLKVSLGKRLSRLAVFLAEGTGWMEQDWRTQVIGDWEVQQKTQERTKLALGYLWKLRMETQGRSAAKNSSQMAATRLHSEMLGHFGWRFGQVPPHGTPAHLLLDFQWSAH